MKWQRSVDRRESRPAATPDITLFLVTMAFLAMGIIMIYSSSYIMASYRYGDGYFFLKRQVVRVVIGLAAMALLTGIDYRSHQKWAKAAILGTISLLVLVLIPGFGSSLGQIKGANRWLDLALFSFQPSELAKIAVVIYAADVLTRKRDSIGSFFYGVLPQLIVIGAVFLLVLLQPDFGYAFIILLVALVLLFVGQVRLLHFLALGLAVIPTLYLAVYRVPYRWNRVVSFLNPGHDLQGSNWQLSQSILGIGSGGLFGAGLGQSKEKLFYLPEAHTDFIFSIIGEELGFIGTMLLLLAILIFAWRGFTIAFRCRDRFGAYTAFGLTFIITICALTNIAVASGLFPVTGLPLPFISYGGSSIVVSLASVGILLNISRNCPCRQGE